MTTQGHSGSGIAGQHLEERKRRGQDRYEITPKKRVELRPFGRQIRLGWDHGVRRFIHTLGGDGIGCPAMEEPRHEELNERRIGGRLGAANGRMGLEFEATYAGV
jgi:hypothetical protein